jgi:multidrug efflux system membrane fusion protein
MPHHAARRAHQRGGVRWGGLLLLLALIGGGLLYWKSRAGAQPAAEPAAASSAAGRGGPPGRRFGAGVQPVSVAAARQRDVPVMLQAIGTISAANTAVVRAQVSGVLQSVHFKEGQMVKQGQLLAQIDPRSFEAALAQAQGTLARDSAQLKNAQLDLARYQDLLAKDSIARQQVDTQQALVRQLQGTVQADEGQVASAKLQLSYTRITAPISGRAGLRQIDVGNVINPSDANGLVSITQTDPIHAVFSVPEANLPAIRRKLNAGEALAVEAWDRELKNRLGVGKLVAVDNAIDAATGTIKIKAQLDNRDGLLFPNQFVNIRLRVDTVPNAMVVPGAAVQRGAQGIYVYLLKDDGTVTARAVQPGVADGDWVVVQGDIKPGDKVVTDGIDRLREGAKVEVIAAPNTAAGRSMAPGAGAPQAAASGTAAGAAAEAAPPWLDRLPPELRDKVMKMSPDERREFLRKLREQRQQQGN